MPATVAGKESQKGRKEKVRGCLVVSCPSSCTLFVAAVDADRAVAVAMVFVDFAATTATPVIYAGSEAAGTVSVAVDHVLDMASVSIILKVRLVVRTQLGKPSS